MNKPKILVVDDQELNIILMKKTMRNVEVDLVEADSGEKAIEILTNDKDFDLILMDVQMPGLSGFDTVKIIKSNESIAEIPVIFITAYYDQSEYIKQGYNLGAFDYIIKPFDKNTLIGKIQLYLSLKYEKKINLQQSESLKLMNRSLSILNECNNALIYSENENEMLNAFCSIIVELGGYPLVWIGTVSKDEITNNSYEVTPLAFFADSKINSEVQIETGTSKILQCDIITNKILSPTFEFVPCESSCEFCREIKFSNTLKVLTVLFNPDHKKNYLLSVYAYESYIFNDSERELISSITASLVYGISALKDKISLKNYQKELLREKEELSTTLRGITDGVIFFQTDGKIMYFNEAASKILEIDADSMKVMRVFDLFQIMTDDGEILFNPVDILQNTNHNDNSRIQLSIRNHNNKKLILSGKIAGIKSNKDLLEGITFFFQDITEQVKIANELTLAQKMESVGRLASGIAHEINTPLQFIGDNNFFLKDAADSILEYFKIIDFEINKINDQDTCSITRSNIKKAKEDLGIDFLSEEMKKSIKSNLDGIQRVSKIVLAMKNFAHPSGKQKVLSDINSTIETTSVISKNEWKYDAELELDLNPDLPAIYCVTDEINQVLLNMIINSVHAIQEFKLKQNSNELGKITIKTDFDDKWLTIEITDSGTGISQENIDKIFDPFFTTKPVGKGTGQGLPIVHDIIVNKHQGRINVESQIGKFTKFIISLPR